MIAKKSLSSKITFIIFILLFVNSSPKANFWEDVLELDEISKNLRNDEDLGIGFRYFGNDAKVGAFGFLEFTQVKYYYNDKIDYQFNHFTFSFGRWKNSEYVYSFTGPINLILYQLTKQFNKLLYSDTLKVNNSPLKYIIFAPNSQINLKLFKNMKLAAGINTEFLFYRRHDGYRGIVFSPFIGFNISGGKQSYWNGITFHVTNSSLLNFEGHNPKSEWLLGVKLILTDFPH